MDERETTPRTGPFVALRFRDFRLFWVGQLISNIGDFMQITAVSWLLYEITGSPFKLGINGAFRASPLIALGLFGGALADRFDRKRLLLASQLAFMVLACALGVLVQTGAIRDWHIYLFTFFNGLVRAVEGPCRQAFYPSLVPRSALANAVALNSLLWKGTMLVGPALGGVAITAVGIDGAFYANAASFLAVVAALTSMRTPSRAPRRGAGFLPELKDGLRYVFSERLVVAIMTMEAASSLFGLDQAMLTIFARDILKAGPSGLGFLQSARGLGAIVGSGLLVSTFSDASHGKIVLWSAIAYGLSFALFGLSESFVLSLFLLALAGAADAMWSGARSIILQLRTPEAMRGRVMGIFSLSSRGMHPLGQVETGLVVPLVGAKEATFLGGLLVSGVALAAVWTAPQLLRWERTHPAPVRPDPASEETAP
jgi:MFS family permease